MYFALLYLLPQNISNDIGQIIGGDHLFFIPQFDDAIGNFTH